MEKNGNNDLEKPEGNKIPGFDSFLNEFNVHLSDVITKVFNKSDRPFVIVRNDKIEYVNDTFVKLVNEKSSSDVLGKKFLDFIAEEDWQSLAENIGEMLVSGKMLTINIKVGKNRFYKMNFEAIYLEHQTSFMFVMVGERTLNKANFKSGFYDEITGLPNFYLLEDRLGVAINNENHKDFRQLKNRIVLIGIKIENMQEFKDAKLEEFALRKIASKLVLSLRKTYTITRGLKYHFWILIPDLSLQDDIVAEARQIKDILDEPMYGEFVDYNVKTSVGASVYPDKATSAKRLLEQVIEAISKAHMDEAKEVVFFEGYDSF